MKGKLLPIVVSVVLLVLFWFQILAMRRPPARLQKCLVWSCWGGSIGVFLFAISKDSLTRMAQKVASLLSRVGFPWPVAEWGMIYLLLSFTVAGIGVGGAIGWCKGSKEAE